ncbi:hypothetical protein BX616_003205, partial [Lobosporangium transversale]
QINVGPSPRGAFDLPEYTRLLISQEKQDQLLLDDTVFGLAQVRTDFGHPATYTTSQARAEGHNDFEMISAAVFTLYLWKIQGAKVFYQLCQKTVPRKKAKNHCRRCEEITGELQKSIVDEDNDGALQTDAIVGSQRPHSDIEDTTDIWTSLCGSVPTNMLQSTLVNMNASVYHINGRAMILTQKHRSSCDPSSQSPTRS